MVKGAVNPEDPFSKEHWLNSFGVVTTILGVRKAAVSKGIPNMLDDIPRSSKVAKGANKIDDVSPSSKVAKGATEPTYSSFRDLMSPEEVLRYDDHWRDVAENMSNEAIDKEIAYIKNGGITRAGGGPYQPSKVSAAVDMNTGDVHIGYSGKRGFNPSKPISGQLETELQDLVNNTKRIAANDPLNPYASKSSYQPWPVENCAEIYATNNALINNADINNIFLNTKSFFTEEYAKFCKNCEITFKNFLTVRK